MPAKVTKLRVLAGRYKGQSLDSPRSDLTHPMGAREKNALFNIVQPHLAGARVLDLFAGSGALGIEALSRGAQLAVFVEQNPATARVIQANLAKIGLKSPILHSTSATSTPSVPEITASGSPASECGQTKVYAADVLKFAHNPSYQGQFDLILADPPYHGFAGLKPVSGAINSLSGPNSGIFTPNSAIFETFQSLSRLLAPAGHLVLSSPSALPPLNLIGLESINTHTYAAARLTLYRSVGQR